MTLLSNFEDVYKITISTTHFYYGFQTWEVFVGVSDSDYEPNYELKEDAKKALVNCIVQVVEKRCASFDSAEVEIIAGVVDGKYFGWNFKGNPIELEEWELGKASIIR